MYDEFRTHIPLGTALNRDKWERVLRADVCAYCGGEGGTIDHIVPQTALEKGEIGRSSFRLNGTGCCADCNNLKSNRPLLVFLLKRARIHDNQRHSFFTADQIDAMKKAV